MINVETPCILIDVNIMKRNIFRMSDIAKKNNVELRPHVKTHKIPQIAKIQLEAGASGITVAKVSEAEVMAQHGIDDIFIAYPVIGDSKIKRVLALNDKIRLIIGVDSLTGAQALSQAADSAGKTIEVRLEVDTGLRRTGIPYDKFIKVAKEISVLKGLKVTGIYTFKGLTYECRPTDDRRKAGIEEGNLMTALVQKLREEGMDVKDVSVGSTPTAEFAAAVSGITEVRPGTYVFNDVMQVNVGSCSLSDCAASILVTVVSVPDKELAVIDGGSKTFPTDVSLNTFPYFLKGYGMVEKNQDFILDRLSEEHGMITIKDGSYGKLKIGQKVSIIPNHICPAVNLQDRVYFVENGKVIRKVAVAARGKVY